MLEEHSGSGLPFDMNEKALSVQSRRAVLFKIIKIKACKEHVATPFVLVRCNDNKPFVPICQAVFLFFWIFCFYQVFSNRF